MRCRAYAYCALHPGLICIARLGAAVSVRAALDCWKPCVWSIYPTLTLGKCGPTFLHLHCRT